jgi:hypothetical protein
MISDFASLLEQAGLDTSGPGFWRRVVMLHNSGILPAQRLDDGDVMAARGFNALVLDRSGVPTHFCKCRPPMREWVRQTELCTRLSTERDLTHVIPQTWGVGSPDLHIWISTYVPGRVLEPTVSWMRLARLDAALREILQAMTTLSQHGAVVAPQLFKGQTHIDLAAESEWAFEAIPPSLLSPRHAEIVRDAILAAGMVRRVLQHGDLWPRNILEHDGHWWLLDLEIFGRIQVPLYDAFHLVRCCWALGQGRLRRALQWSPSPAGLPTRLSSWIEHLRSSATMQPYQRTLAWARVRHGLTNAEAVGTLAFYLIDVAARMYRRQLRMQYVAPYLRDLTVLAECLVAGETFAHAFHNRN